MAIHDILEVTVHAEEESYLYTVTAKAACTGKIKVVLSEKRETKPESRLEAASHWDDISGTALIKKSLLEGKEDLFLYLLDEDSEVTSTIVTVYCQPLKLVKWVVAADGSLVLIPDRGRSDYEFSSKLILRYQNNKGIASNYSTDLPATRIPLDRLELWMDTDKFTFTLEYFRKSEKADIFGIASQQITAYFAPPKAASITYATGKFTIAGSFLVDAPLWATVWAGDTPLKSAAVTGGVFDVSDQGLDSSGDYAISLCYKTEQGASLESAHTLVVLEPPEVTHCTFEGENAVLTLRDSGVYKVTVGQVTANQAGRRVKVPKATQSVSLCKVRGLSQGPAVALSVEAPAFYPVKVGEAMFYSLQKRPDALKTDQDITVAIQETATGAEPYTGTFFQVTVAEEKATLTIKKELYAAKPADVHADYAALCQTYAAGSLFKPLRQAVLSNIPMSAEDLLFYCCDCSMADGYTGISEGMSLLVEYALYQNIPGESLGEEESTLTDLSGFTGTGMARYQVVRRGSKLTVEPFASGINCTVPAPKAMSSDNKLCGGSGVADLLYKGFAAGEMRLVYPLSFTERTSVGELVYADNICLLASDKPDKLLEATGNLRRKALSVTGVAYHYFRGRSVVVPQICVTVNGQAQWVSLGTTLADLMAERGAASAALRRRWEGTLYPVESPEEAIPLLLGDCIEV